MMSGRYVTFLINFSITTVLQIKMFLSISNYHDILMKYVYSALQKVN